MATGADFDQNVNYLRDVQYRDSTELAKRANLHTTYRTAPQLAFDFFAALIDWPAGGRVLDAGGGSGYLWDHVAAIAPEGIDLVVTDLSNGMVDEAVERARGTGRFASVEGYTCDARNLPFEDEAFDVVVSTYALYHVPDPGDAVAELARVVRDDGTVGIMTNGPRHLHEIEQVRVAVFGDDARYEVNRTFPPATAASMLVEHFDDVHWRRFDDTLHVTDLDDIMAFITSTPPANDATPVQVEQLHALALQHMRDGIFVVSKDTGALVCRNPKHE